MWKPSDIQPDLFSIDLRKEDSSAVGRHPMRSQNRLANLRDRTAIFLTLVMVLLPRWTAAAQNVQIYVSSKAGDRLTAKPELRFEQPTGPESTDFQIDDTVAFQKMDGFGASLLEAGLIVLNDLAPAEQEAVLRALFDPKEGAGFSAMKTVLASTDFMSAGPFYTYALDIGKLFPQHRSGRNSCFWKA
jgi:hypothetical protein